MMVKGKRQLNVYLFICSRCISLRGFVYLLAVKCSVAFISILLAVRQVIVNKLDGIATIGQLWKIAQP